MSGVWASVDKSRPGKITIDSINFAVGEDVKKNDLIGTVINDINEEEQVFAPIAGTIKEVLDRKYIGKSIIRYYGDLARIEEHEADKKAREKEAREKAEKEAREKAEKEARDKAEEEARDKAEEETRLKYNNLYYSIQFETGDEINYKIHGKTHKITITHYNSKIIIGRVDDKKAEEIAPQYIINNLVHI